MKDLEKKIREFFYGKEPPNKSRRTPSITHYEWEEDGKQYSSWKIDTGSMSIHCGDAGKEMFDKAVKEQLEKDMFQLEQELDIPYRDRYYNKDK